MKKHLKLYKEFIKIDFKRITFQNIDFLIGNLGYLLDALSTFFSTLLVITVADSIGGWNTYQIVFLSSYMLLVSSLWELFCVTTLDIPDLVISGQLDTYLVRPLNTLFQIITREIDEQSIFEVIFSAISLGFCWYNLELEFSFISVTIFLLFLLSSILALESIYLAISSLSFWIGNSLGGLKILWELKQICKYPLTIYPVYLKAILIIVPFAFISFFPVKKLLYLNPVLNVDTIICIFSGPIFFLASYMFIWKKGLKVYNSTGS